MSMCGRRAEFGRNDQFCQTSITNTPQPKQKVATNPLDSEEN